MAVIAVIAPALGGYRAEADRQAGEAQRGFALLEAVPALLRADLRTHWGGPSTGPSCDHWDDIEFYEPALMIEEGPPPAQPRATETTSSEVVHAPN